MAGSKAVVSQNANSATAVDSLKLFLWNYIQTFQAAPPESPPPLPSNFLVAYITKGRGRSFNFCMIADSYQPASSLQEAFT